VGLVEGKDQRVPRNTTNHATLIMRARQPAGNFTSRC